MNDNKLNIIDWIALTLLTVGGLNWGLVGLFDFNLVSAIFQIIPLIKVVYTLVGVAAVYSVFLLYKLKNFR